MLTIMAFDPTAVIIISYLGEKGKKFELKIAI